MMSYYSQLSPAFYVATCAACTLHCGTLADAAGILPRLFADAYLMGGEL